jgi:acetyl esterase/lipase
MRVFEDLRYGPHPEQKLDIYLPEGQCNVFMVWFHGGSLKFGSRKDIRFHEDLMEHGIGVASVEYRMYPNVNFPVFVEDAAESVHWLTENLKQYTDCQKIYVSGQSAGAWLTLMLAFDEHYLRDAGVDPEKIAGFISDSAQITSHFSVLRERGMDYRLERIDEAAPIYFLTEHSRVTNLLLIAYEEDMPCRPEQNQLFYKSIRRICPHIPVELKTLPGEHCSGSSGRNEKGIFAFNDAVLDYLKM